jgi:hypothetical protein
MSILIDLKDYEIKNSEDLANLGEKGRVRLRIYPDKPFLKGPIPLWWLQEAIRIGKCALVTGIALWCVDGMRFQRSFRIGKAQMGKLLGVNSRTILRGVKRLEEANLIFVFRQPGNKLIVTLNRKKNRGGE